MIKGVIHAHLGPIWYHSGPSDVPYSPKQFLGWDFFVASYSKPALVHIHVWILGCSRLICIKALHVKLVQDFYEMWCISFLNFSWLNPKNLINPRNLKLFHSRIIRENVHSTSAGGIVLSRTRLVRTQFSREIKNQGTNRT